MSKYIKLEDAKAAIREKFKSIEDRIEINNVLNGLPTLNITEYADKHQAYSEGYAKGVVYGGLLKSEVSEDCISREYILNGLSEMADDWVINNAVQHGIYEAHDFVKNAPSVLPSREEGEWIYIDEPIMGNPYGRYRCSGCEMDKPHKTDYCPNCGAKMEE